MTMKIKNALFGAALALSVPGAAMAQQTTGFYVGGAGGYNILEDADISRITPGVSATFKDGWAASGTAGYGLGNGIRLELEYAYRENKVDKLGGTGGSGTATSHAVLTNVLYDFATGTPFTPYVGAGLGVGRVSYDDFRLGGTPFSASSTEFAYQGIAGVSYGITPNLKIDVDYKYFSTLDPRFQVASARIDSEYHAHTIFVGLRWEFGAPAPAPRAEPVAAPAPIPTPAPAPAPQITRNFLVFFDWDKADITPEASRILQQAAAAAKAGNIARINVTGHTDTSGSPVYNQRLSERRAEAVKSALIQLGLPAGGIATIGRGESQLLVPTADGVREPQNRRAEIVLQ
jgi:outer membrane protein OmpA-like peptidoglycan-associated protein